MTLLTTPGAAALPATASALRKIFHRDAVARDQAGGRPVEQIALLRQSGLLSARIPVAYGGGASWATVLRVVREFAHTGGSLAHLFGHHHLPIHALLARGSTAQQTAWLTGHLAQPGRIQVAQRRPLVPGRRPSRTGHLPMSPPKTNTARRQLHLNVNILHSGFVPSAWRPPEADPGAFIDVQHYIRAARIAETGKLDAVFRADNAAIVDQIHFWPITALEPTVLLAMVAAATSHIGLIGTASTIYNEPFNIARRFATLDHVSGGRAGWNVVTTADLPSARNFGRDALPDRAERYARADEFTCVVKALWNSWEDGAYIGDKASGHFIDPARVHAINHRSPHFSVAGPATLPRSVQGHPVVVQAVGSADGRELAARHAEAVFSASQSFEESLAYGRGLKARAEALGRGTEAVTGLAGLTTIIGGTETEARRRRDELVDLIPWDYSLTRLAGILGVAPDRLKLDERLPANLAPPGNGNGNHTFFNATLALARRHGYTARETIRELAGGGGHRVVVGTPEQIADDTALWFKGGAADGFNLMPDALPGRPAKFCRRRAAHPAPPRPFSQRIRGHDPARAPGAGPPARPRRGHRPAPGRLIHFSSLHLFVSSPLP
ncbi:MAG: Nitrilotriacetate monooxygenase component [Rhodoferax sp.]|nr:Nitrilotriacetate monooxygenase component [Rhodoferax sp.]